MKFFDNLEDRVREKLSKYPNVYAFISGVGIVLFFRGVWLIADNFAYSFWGQYGHTPDGWITLAVSLIILLVTGTLVSHHLQKDVWLSGKKGEKKLVEKDINEIEAEETELKNLQATLNRIETKLDHLEESHPHGEKK